MKTSQVKPIFLFIGITIFLISCQKEGSFETGIGTNTDTTGNGGPGGSIAAIPGDYDFVGMDVKSTTSVMVTSLGNDLKTVTTSDYSTDDNSGTVTITASEFIQNDIAYSFSTMLNTKTYVNNALFDNSDFPSSLISPPVTNTSTYIKISSDSIRVTGTFGNVPDQSVISNTDPVDAKLSWTGDTLMVKAYTNFSKTISQGGIPTQIKAVAISIMKLKKK